MYYVIQKKSYLNLFFSLGQNMRKIMMVKKKECLQNIVVGMY